MNKYSLIAPEIREMINDPDFEQKIRDSFMDLHAHEVSTSLEGLDSPELARIILALGVSKGIDVFEHFDEEDQLSIFLCFDPSFRVTVIEQMSPDERIDLLKILPENIRTQVYRRIDPEERDDIRKLIDFEEGSVGALVTTSYIAVREGDTVKSALNHVRLASIDKELIYYIYVIDDEDRLLGILSLRELIAASSRTLLKNIMNRDVLSLHVQDDQEEAAHMIQDYDWVALPALDDKDRLIGIVTVDDLVDVVEEEVTEDILNLGAAGKHVPYLSSSVFRAARQRVVWLFILIGVGFISGLVLERYQDVLDAVIPLIFFIPMLCASAGNAGTQSATVVIREMATDAIDLKDFWRVLWKEVAIGVLVGFVLGGLVALRAYFMPGASLDDGLKMALTVGVSMTSAIVMATSLGAILPIVCKRLRLDPALMSGPLIASIVDVCCLFTYMELARAMFHL